MIAYNLNDFYAAIHLVKCCEKFKDKFDVDIGYGRYIVDGCSILGVQTIVGHIVSVNPQTEDQEMISQFISELKAYKKVG